MNEFDKFIKGAEDKLLRIEDYISKAMPVLPSKDILTTPGTLFTCIADMANDVSHTTEFYIECLSIMGVIRELNMLRFSNVSGYTLISGKLKMIEGKIELCKEQLYKRLDAVKVVLEAARSIQSNAIQMERIGVAVFNLDDLRVSKKGGVIG